MPSSPAVSYVVAAYNHEQFIGELFDSLRRQTFTDLEIVVVDDGSSDKTAAVARRAAEQDARVRLFEQKHAGVVAARNAGLEQATAPLISIVDSDDIFPADRTARMVAALEQNPAAGLVYGDAEILPRNGSRARFSDIYPVVSGPFSEALFCHYCFVPACSVMFRREVFERTGNFWGPGPNTDYLKWIEMGLTAEAVALRDNILGTWRLHGENVSQANVRNRCQQYEDLCHGLREVIAKHPAFGQRIGPARQAHRYSRCHVMAGFYAARAGEWELAREQFEKARSQERSVLNAALTLSTIRVLRYVSSILFAIAARKRLGPLP